MNTKTVIISMSYFNIRSSNKYNLIFQFYWPTQLSYTTYLPSSKDAERKVTSKVANNSLKSNRNGASVPKVRT